MMPQYASAANRAEQKARVTELEMLLNPEKFADDNLPMIPSGQINKAGLRRRLNQEQQRLETISPPKLTPTQKDSVVKELKLLETAMVKGSAAADIPPMISKQQEWNASEADVGQKIQWENFWKRHRIQPNGSPIAVNPATEQGAIWRWKDLHRALLADAEEDGDPSVSNLESFRPDEPLDAARRSLHSPWAGVSWERYNALVAERQPLSSTRFEVVEVENPKAGRREFKVQKKAARPKSPPAYVCGEMTKAGTVCKRPVKQQGEICSSHRSAREAQQNAG